MMAAAGFIASHSPVRAGFFAALTMTNAAFICASATPVDQRRCTARIAYHKTLLRPLRFIGAACASAAIQLNSDIRCRMRSAVNLTNARAIYRVASRQIKAAARLMFIPSVFFVSQTALCDNFWVVVSDGQR